MSEISFERLHQFFCKVPSVQEARIMAHGADGERAWWFKFSIDVEHSRMANRSRTRACFKLPVDE